METSNRNKLLRSRRAAGYTLVEVLIASGILMMGISAACLMSLAMVTQEEMSHRISRSLNAQENAARLWQLGLADTDVFGSGSILPANPDISMTTAVSNADLGAAGTLPGVVITATIYSSPATSNAPVQSGYWTGGAPADGGARDSRTNVITVYRSLR